MNTTQLKKSAPVLAHANPFFQPDNTFLRTMIDTSMSEDPSLRSMSYLKMTSRKGLFAFEGEYATLLYSVHPNRADTYIVYPPEHVKGYQDVRELAGILKARGRAVEIIRVGDHHLPPCLEATQGRVTEEKTLDYIFPVHIVDTKMVSEMQGGKFLKFRNKINAIRKTPVRLEKATLTPTILASLRLIARRWSALLFGSDDRGSADYIHYVLEEPVMQSLLQGLIAYQEDEAVGFTLWENPALGYGTANSLIHCCLHDRGLSELIHHEMASVLYAQGVRFLSLGGAETGGLDAFKRKMNPVRSLKLHTVTA